MKDNNEMNYEYPQDEFIDATPGNPDESVESVEASTVSTDEQVFSTTRSGISGKIFSFFESLQTNKKNRMIVVGSLVVVVAGVIVVLGSGSHHKSVNAEQSVASVPALQNSSNQLLAQKMHIASVQTDNRLDSAAQSIQSNQQSVARLDNQLGALKSAMGTLTENQQNLQGMIAKLSMQLKQATQEINPVVKKQSVVKAKPITYSLRASIPGRAWVVASNGITRTIKVGDSLPGYGKVKAINAEQGAVLTSSGKVIQLSAGS